MRFSFFSDGQHPLYPPQFHGCSSRSGRGRCSAPTPCCPPQSAPSQTHCDAGMGAAFIPLVWGPRSATRSHPWHSSDPRHSQHCAGPSAHHVPSFDCLKDHVPQSVVSDAISVAQGLLGEIFGQPSNDETSGTTPAGQTTSDQSRSSRGCSAQRKSCKDSSAQGRCNKESSPKHCSKGSCASAPQPSHTTHKQPDHKEKTEPRPSPKVNEGTNEDKSATEPFTSSSPSSIAASDPQWTQTLSFPGFAPNKISMKVNDGKIYVYAIHETAYGPSNYLSEKLQMCKTVTLPDTIDQQSLACSLKPNGTLLFRGNFKKSLAMKNHDEKADSREVNQEAPCMASNLEEMEVAAEKEDKAAHFMKTEAKTLAMMENKDEQIDALENNAEEVKALEHRAEEVKALEHRAEEVKALEHRAEEVKALEHRAEEVKALEHGAEEVKALEITTEREIADDDEPEVDKENQDEQSGEETQTDVKDDEDHMMHLNNAGIFCPIIQEPEDGSFFADEVQEKHSISHQSSSEDFVVIGEGFTNAETINFEDGSEELSRHMESTASEQVQQEKEATEEETEEEIKTHHKADPTRPLKRTESQERTSQHGAFRASMPLVGFNPEDVHVNIQGHTLNIVAKRQAWLGDASYMENVERQVELPGHLDVYSVRCVYDQDLGCLIISADPKVINVKCLLW